jgi:uncharacterized membrane-anchored protein
MAYTRNAEYRSTTNSKISSRGKQMIALIGAIVIGMIISGAMNALPSSKSVNLSTKATTVISPSTNN